MDTWSLPKTRPISCNDCPAFQRLHRSVLCVAESLTRLACVINTTFSEKIYIRWCCIDRLSRHRFSGCGAPSHVTMIFPSQYLRANSNFNRFVGSNVSMVRWNRLMLYIWKGRIGKVLRPRRIRMLLLLRVYSLLSRGLCNNKRRPLPIRSA